MFYFVISLSCRVNDVHAVEGIIHTHINKREGLWVIGSIRRERIFLNFQKFTFKTTPSKKEMPN